MVGLYSEGVEPETAETVGASSSEKPPRAGRADRWVADKGGGGRKAAAIF